MWRHFQVQKAVQMSQAKEPKLGSTLDTLPSVLIGPPQREAGAGEAKSLGDVVLLALA